MAVDNLALSAQTDSRKGNMGEYWLPKYRRHLENDEWYDEDGFAKGLPRNHPARVFKELADALSGEKPGIKIRKDYTQEFSKAATGVYFYFPVVHSQVKVIRVATKDPEETRDIEFEIEITINGERFKVPMAINRLLSNTQEEFDEWRLKGFHKALATIHRQVQRICDHTWMWLPNDNVRIWVKCSKCGLEQHDPQ